MTESKCVGGIGGLCGNQYHQQNRVYKMGDISLCHPANIPGGSYMYLEIKKMNKINVLGRLDSGGFDMRNRIYSDDGISPALDTMQGENKEPKIVQIKQATKTGYIPCEIGGVADLNYPDSKTRRGRVQGKGQICPTLTTENIPSVLEDWTWKIGFIKYLIRIRKLTPRECWRLMDFSDEDFDKAQAVNSDSQLYKQAGNSIVKNVLVEVLRPLFEGGTA